MIGRRQAMAGGAALGASLAGAPGLAATPAGPMSGRASYDAYLAAFNARQIDTFTRFYADDVRMYLGGRAPIEGRQGIIAWYDTAWRYIEEHCTLRRFIMDESGVAVELETEFRAIADWPDFPSGPFLTGDRLVRIGFGHYDLKDGYFSRVATALHRVVEQPSHWTKGAR